MSDIHPTPDIHENDYSNWTATVNVEKLYKTTWVKRIIKFVADIDRKSGNKWGRMNLLEMTKFPGLWIRGANKHKKENLLMFAYFQDVRHNFIDLFSSLLRNKIHQNTDRLGMYFDEYAEYHDWWWFWENLDTIFENVFMKKIMEHIDRTIENPEYLKLL